MDGRIHRQKMKGRSIFGVLSCVLFVDISTAQWSSTGLSHSFTFYTANLGVNDAIVWSFKNKTTNYAIAIFQCSQFYERCDLSENKFKELYSANLITNSSTITSVFTINSVTPFQHNSTWMCKTNRQGYNVTEQYDLYVFAAPERPTCYDVALLNEKNIHIACKTQKVFPRSLCLFFFITNKSEPAEVRNGHINYTHEENNSTGFYKTTCSYTVFAGSLGPGTHQFYVVMYPDIASTITEDIKNNSLYTTPIEMSYPEALLSSDCKVNSYVKENETGHCTCYNNKSSFVPTHITWSTGESKFESKGENNNFTLNFTAIIPSKGNQSFSCIISNFLNWTHTIVFQPNIAYPPSTVNLIIPEQELTICTDSNVNISGSCLISKSNPEPSVQLKINDFPIDMTANKNSEYVFTTAKSSTGLFNISCIAKNYDFETTSSKTVTIRGPPDVPKIFREAHHMFEDVLQVRDGETLTCESSGGYPPSKNLTLKCGNDSKHAFDLDQVELTLNISHVKLSTNLTCECNVWHVTHCPYNKTTIQVELLVSAIHSDQEDGLQKIQIAIGVAVACAVIIITLIIIVITISNSQVTLRSSGLTEKLVENEDLYFIRDEKSTTDLSLYPEYTNVVTSMTSAMEAPKNFKKQA